MNTLEAIGHATSVLLALGFCVFLWIIAKDIRKMKKRARKAIELERAVKKLLDVPDKTILDPQPNSVWVATDINVDIPMKPGSVPKTFDDLMDFSDCLNEFLVQNGAQWARYILFNETGNPVCDIGCNF